MGAARCAERPRRCDLRAGVRTDERSRTIVVRLVRPDADLLAKLALPFAFVHRDGVGTGPYRVATASPRGVRLVRNPRFATAATRPARVRRRDPHLSDRLTRRRRPRARRPTCRARGWRSGPLRRPPAHGAAARDAVPLPQHAGRAVRRPARAARGQPRGRPRARARRLRRGAVDVDLPHDPAGLPGHRPECPSRRRRRGAARGRRAGARGRRSPSGRPRASGRWPRTSAGHAQHRPAGARPHVPALGLLPGDRGPADARAGRHHGLVHRPAVVVGVRRPLFRCANRGATNYSQLCDRELERLSDRAQQATEPADAAARWARVERRLTALDPVVPLLHNRQPYLLSPRAGNFAHHPMWGPLLDQVWVR